MPEGKLEWPGLMVMDMQNDFCKRNGVFARHGFDVSGIEKIVPAIKKVMEFCKAGRIPIIATKLTIWTDLDGKAMGLAHLKVLRPFLADDGFRDGSWGQRFIEDLPRPDYEVRKWGYSAMYQTELEKIIAALELKTLVFTGIATNGVVEGTARDAAMRDYHVVTLSDCVAAYNPRLHEASMLNLANIGKVVTSAEAMALLK